MYCYVSEASLANLEASRKISQVSPILVILCILLEVVPRADRERYLGVLLGQDRLLDYDAVAPATVTGLALGGPYTGTGIS